MPATLPCPPGLAVGHATDDRLRSGVTVFLPDRPAVAAVHVSGGAPATRETDLLRPGNLVQRVDAIVLSGGSVFGLAAADGVVAWLAEAGRGFPGGGLRVPIVPAASLFDLANGGGKSDVTAPNAGLPSPYWQLGYSACAAASAAVPLGSLGAGAGATTADLKGGFGMASRTLSDGGSVTAFAAVNSVGTVTFGATGEFRAAAFEINDEFGGLGFPASLPADAGAVRTKGLGEPGSSTTIAVIATDLDLTRDEAIRIAVAGHDGIAISVFPAHTPLDGDAVFVLATGLRQGRPARRVLVEACAAAASTLARAVARGVYEAEPAEGDRVPAWRQLHGARR